MPSVVGPLPHALSQGFCDEVLHGGIFRDFFCTDIFSALSRGEFFGAFSPAFFPCTSSQGFSPCGLLQRFFRGLFHSSFSTLHFCKKFCCALSHNCFYRGFFCGAFLSCTVLRETILSTPSWGSFPSTFQQWLCACAFL